MAYSISSALPARTNLSVARVAAPYNKRRSPVESNADEPIAGINVAMPLIALLGFVLHIFVCIC